MKMEQQFLSDEEYEYALAALNDCRIRESEEFGKWLQEESHRQLFAELSDCREAALNLRKEMLPDTGRAWERLSVRLKKEPASLKRRNFRRAVWIGSCAAVLLGAVLGAVSAWKHEREADIAAVYYARSGAQEVVLQTEDGARLSLDGRPDGKEIEQIGAEVDAQQGMLSYRRTQETAAAVHTLITPRGKDFKVMLDDGTEVWLNAESSLVYPVRFTGGARTVELEGEAFFHVAKDEARPFVVKSGGTEAHVLGTRFNFRAYAGEERHITLISGCVKVSDPASANELVLQPGQDVLLGQKTLHPQEVDIDEYAAWTKGFFCFSEAPLTEIMKTLGRWYNLTVVFRDEAAMHYHFSFWASRKESPAQTLRRLNEVGKVEATLENGLIIVN